MFKEIYDPTQKKCNVPQNLGYDTKSLCSEQNSTIVHCKESLYSLQMTNISLSKNLWGGEKYHFSNG